MRRMRHARTRGLLLPHISKIIRFGRTSPQNYNEVMKQLKKKTRKKSPRGQFAASSHARNLQHLRLLLSVPKIQQLVSSARLQLELPDIGSQDFFEKIAIWSTENTVSRFDREELLSQITNQIMDLAGLPKSYEDSIRTYVVSDITSVPAFIFSEGPYLADELIRKPRNFVTITFHSKVTDADLRDLKKYVNNVAGRFLIDSHQELSGVDKMLAIEALQIDRIREDISTDTTYEVPTKEIAEYVGEEIGERVTIQDVYENKRALKKLRKKRFGNLENDS